MDVLATMGATAATNIATNAATGSITRIMSFKDNHKSLSSKMNELRALRDHVKRRITIDEDNALTRTPVVSQWLDRVEEINKEVVLILEEGTRQIEQRCGIVDCYLKNWWTHYKLGKKFCKMLSEVEELSAKGSFDSVADDSCPIPLQLLHESQTVGLDELFCKVWKLLEKDKVKIMGIYGMGGVGKTALLKKLNNAFCNEAHKFDVVIWVVLSKQFSIRNIQREIGRRLGLAANEEGDQTEKAEGIFNALRKKKFVVMLDDVWEPMELEAIGIPSLHASHSNSKLVFTTRSEDVCGGMECDEKVKVSVLDWGQSWILFRNKLGQEALRSHPEIPKLAEEVAKGCCGLPLALITIARAMSSKKTPPEWKHAVKILKSSVSEFPGMEKKVLASLKFSYDNLGSNTVKSCFLYLSLHSEDNISKVNIIHHWIGEGLLDEFEEMDEATNKGHAIIGILKASCLLESGDDEELYVKMHGVVRDLALWIARECGKKQNKYLVHSGFQLMQAPNIEIWKEAERLSLTNNMILELADAPECSYLLTLLLQGNSPLSSIAIDFFQSMPRLRVLNLSDTSIKVLPKSIGTLVELQFLDLQCTHIKTLPEELGNLVELRYLNLGLTLFLEYIPHRMLSYFPRLKMLDLYCSGALVDGNLWHVSVEDLESLKHMRDLRITVTQFPLLSSILLSQKLSSCITKLYLYRCRGLTKLSLASSTSTLINMKKLYELAISNCLEIEELEIIDSGTEENDLRLLMNLTSIQLFRLPMLNITWRDTCSPVHFKNLSCVSIEGCDVLKDLSWLVLVPVLKDLTVYECKEVEEIIRDEFPCSTVDNQTTFSRLKLLELHGLPQLKCICQVALPFPCLEIIYMTRCPLVKRLPFTSNSTKKPSLQIKGETEWWNALYWEDQTVQSSFQPFFTRSEL